MHFDRGEFFRQLNVSSTLRGVLEPSSRKSKLKWEKRSKIITETRILLSGNEFFLQYSNISHIRYHQQLLRTDLDCQTRSIDSKISIFLTEWHRFVTARSNQMKWRWSMLCKNCYFPIGTMPWSSSPSDPRVSWYLKFVRSATGSLDMAIAGRRIACQVFSCTMDPPLWNLFWELKWVALRTRWGWAPCRLF